MPELLRIEAPSDAQLALIDRLCREQGWQHPGAVYSKAEASEIIGAMFASTYRPERYGIPGGCDFEPDYDDEDVPF